MERKLIPQGLGGFTVYLPKKWIDKKGLSKDDTVSIFESNNDLIIRKEKTIEKGITIKLDDVNIKYLNYWLTHIYRKNFNKITFVGQDLPLKKINQLVETLLLGFTVTESTETKCVIENIAEPSGEKYGSILRRLFFIIKDNINSIEEALNQNNKEKLNEVIKSREDFDKYIYFCKRVTYHDRYSKDPLVQWELLTFITHIQHSIVYFTEYLKENFQVTNTLNKFTLGLKEYFQTLYNANFTLEVKHLFKLMKEREKYHFGGIQKTLNDNKDNTNPAILAHLQTIFRLVQISASPIFEEYLDNHEQD